MIAIGWVIGHIIISEYDFKISTNNYLRISHVIFKCMLVSMVALNLFVQNTLRAINHKIRTKYFAMLFLYTIKSSANIFFKCKNVQI